MVLWDSDHSINGGPGRVQLFYNPTAGTGPRPHWRSDEELQRLRANAGAAWRGLNGRTALG